MTSSSRQRGLALGLVGALTLATPALAGPVLTNTTGVKAAVEDGVVDVRWRHRGGGGVAAGLAFGALAGAAIGAATAPRYYGYPAYYGGGYYPTYYGSTYPSYADTYPAYGAYTAQGPVVYGGPTYGYTYGSSYAYPNQTCGFYGGYGRWDYSQC
jgi:hypothetical protein